MDLLTTLLSQQPFLALFLVIAGGYAIGATNLMLFSLGVGAVLSWRAGGTGGGRAAVDVHLGAAPGSNAQE